MPPQFVFVAGIEPSSSLVITLMIPELYVLMLREMLEAGDVLTHLRGTGVDVIEINGEKSFGIKSRFDWNNILISVVVVFVLFCFFFMLEMSSSVFDGFSGV